MAASSPALIAARAAPKNRVEAASSTEAPARVMRIRAELMRQPYSICLERPSLLRQFRKTVAFKAGSHYLVRRAQALAYVFAERKPRIFANELIIGNLSSKRLAGNYYTEGTSFNILEDVLRLDKRTAPLKLSTLEKIRLVGLGVGGIPQSILFKAMVRPGRIRHILNMVDADRYIVTEQAGVSHQIGNYSDIVHHGLIRSDQLAAACLARNHTPGGVELDADQHAFYESIQIIIAGIREMAANLAAEAEIAARRPGVRAERRVELLNIADTLRHVPYHPARNFHEGLQACWILHMAMCLEDFEQGLSFGRLDLALRELYEQDIARGDLTPQQARELIACFELKCGESIPLYSERMDKYFSGMNVAHAITLGGVDMKGQDVTTELSGLFLDAYAWLGTREPNIHARIHAGTPPWFLEKCMETLQKTGTRPALMGDKAIIEALQQAGMTLEHARDYGIIGCTELGSQGRTYNSADAALFNLPICLELALNQGRSFAGKKCGAATPPLAQMSDMDAVYNAYHAQVDYAIAEMSRVMGWLEAAYRVHRTTPVNSVLTEGCLESGKDVTAGGATYDYTSIQAVGLADTGDSLYAIKRLVFEEKRYSLSELVAILKADYAGHEELALELKNRFPRFGNGIAEVDSMVQLAADAFTDVVTAHRNTRGGKWLAGFYSMTCGYAFGRFTGALPNGRHAGARLSNGVSPVDGADRQGPTAMLRSVAGLDKIDWGNCHVLNVKFDTKTVEGMAGRKILSSLFRNYLVDRDGMQVQVNVLDAGMLLEARKNPAAFPNLVVRVSGYCAYFHDLQPEVQDEIIERALHGISH